MGLAIRGALRRRVVGAAALVAVIALLAGGAMTALAGARRSSTALDRFLAYCRPEDAYVAPGDDGTLDMDQVAALPQVAASMYEAYVVMVPVDDQGRAEPGALGSINPYLYTMASGPPGSMMRQRVLEGRRLDPAVPSEVMVDEELARARRLSPGDHLRMASYTPDQMDLVFGDDRPEPAGPVLDLEVVGVVRAPVDVAPGRDEADLTYGSTMDLYLSPALYAAHGDEMIAFGAPEPNGNRAILLRHGRRDLRSFEEAVQALPGGAGATIESGGSDTEDAARTARRAIAVETVSLAGLGLALVVAAVILVTQAMARLARGSVPELASLRALGLRPGELLVVAAAPGLIASTLGALASLGTAIAGSAFTPIGLGRTAEVSPGVQADALVMGAGALAVLLGGTLTAVLTAWPTVRGLSSGAGTRPARTSWLVARLAALGAPASATLGARFAVEARGARRATLRYAATATALALAVLTGALTYTRSVDHLLSDRREQGAEWDLTLGNPNLSDYQAADEERLVASPLVTGAGAVASPEGRGTVDGVELAISGFDSLAGDLNVHLTAGRAASALGEVVLGRRTAEQLHVGIGDRVDLRFNATSRRMRVVGVAVLNPGLAYTTELGRGAVVTIAQLHELAPDVPINVLLVRLAPGTTVGQAIGALDEPFGGAHATPAAIEAINLHRVRSLPLALAAAIVAAAGILLAAALVTSARERRRDLAVVRAIGATRRQVAGALTWQGAWLFAAALVGLPVGVAAGRLVWQGVAHQMGVLAAAEVPYGSLGIVAVAGLVVSLGLAAAQAVGGLRRAPARDLQVE
jgi:ABC-type lipoprotein release transport system permease subunit